MMDGNGSLTDTLNDYSHSSSPNGFKKLLLTIACKNLRHDIVTLGELMARGRLQDTTTLQMALVGYQIEKDKIDDKIRAIQSQLKGKRVSFSSAPGAAAPATKRVLSPAARKRIAAAQKKRWAEHRKKVAAAAKAE
jgi:hypothetical protein